MTTLTRPDLSSASHNLANYSDYYPGSTHGKALSKVLQYLKRTADLGVTYRGSDPTDMGLT